MPHFSNGRLLDHFRHERVIHPVFNMSSLQTLAIQANVRIRIPCQQPENQCKSTWRDAAEIICSKVVAATNPG